MAPAFHSYDATTSARDGSAPDVSCQATGTQQGSKAEGHRWNGPPGGPGIRSPRLAAIRLPWLGIFIFKANVAASF